MTATLSARTAVTTCAAPGKNHQADAGTYLCRAHFDQVAEWLADIDREVDALDARPSMQGNWQGARGGKLASHAIPVRINAVVHRDPRRVPVGVLTGSAGLDDTLSAFDTLYYWANMIRDERSIRMPGHWVIEQLASGPVCLSCRHPSCRRMVHRFFERDPLDVGTERLLISRHLDWAATQPWIGALWSDLRTLRSQLQAVNGTGEVRLGGRCPECGGHLHAVKPQHTSETFVHVGSSLLQAVECERDADHRWEDKHLIRLALILEEQQRSAR